MVPLGNQVHALFLRSQEAMLPRRLIVAVVWWNISGCFNHFKPIPGIWVYRGLNLPKSLQLFCTNNG